MKTSLVWNDAMEFDGVVGSHSVRMDAKAPIGKETGPTPKELLALGLGGCTAMDVIAYLKKNRQQPQSFQVEVDVQTSTGSYPVVFEKATVIFNVVGAVDAKTLSEAARLSQTKYCGVSAMLVKAFPIEYRILLNGEEIDKGFANFEST